MTMSTIYISYRLIVLFDRHRRRAWHRPTLLAEVFYEPETGKAGRAATGGGERCGAGADHRDDVVAADGAGQPAQARRDPALQAAGRSVLGRVWPGGVAGAAAADERGAAGGSGRRG